MHPLREKANQNLGSGDTLEASDGRIIQNVCDE
jgi:hypothetical protein